VRARARLQTCLFRPTHSWLIKKKKKKRELRSTVDHVSLPFHNCVIQAILRKNVLMYREEGSGRETTIGRKNKWNMEERRDEDEGSKAD
jgi:hypothetical protein